MSIRRLIRAYRSIPKISHFFEMQLEERLRTKTPFWKSETELEINKIIPPLKFKRVDIQVVSKLPKLNWRVLFDEGGICRIQAGENVELSDHYVFEGVWAGSFETCDFTESRYVFGSGVKINRDSISFTPPTHNLESIYLFHDKGTHKTVFSNSLISCIAEMPVEKRDQIVKNLAPTAHLAATRMAEKGVLAYDPLAYSFDGISVYFLQYHNFTISSADGGISIELKNECEKFEDFDGYVEFMKETISNLDKNGKHLKRKRRLEGLCTISSGYDSPAVSVICSDVGIEKYCTIDSVIHGRSDSGADISKALKISCNSYTHPLGKEVEDLNAVVSKKHLENMDIFLATFGVGDNYPIKAFEAELADTVLYTGGYGDIYWAKDQVRRSGFRLKKPLERSITEYRLEQGFAFVPVPSIGALFPESIFKISNSHEMKHWSLGGKYDRPIPRRIVESRGVPRSFFGVKKNAVNPVAENYIDRKIMSFHNVLKKYT